MGKRKARDAGPVPVSDQQAELFDVPRPEPTAEPKIVRCSECNTRLRSPRSMAAGVSERCAAKVGVAVLATMRRSKGAGRSAA
ncbi:hypothetical protein ACKI16_29350 [Streptomyces scabiei]|uniref:hypothetical protein n=1 Tax=Streptomyces scabiei TaxID=1930 RepID=UPI0038F7E15D